MILQEFHLINESNFMFTCDVFLNLYCDEIDVKSAVLKYLKVWINIACLISFVESIFMTFLFFSNLLHSYLCLIIDLTFPLFLVGNLH